jgi:hypothetical protein
MPRLFNFAHEPFCTSIALANERTYGCFKRAVLPVKPGGRSSLLRRSRPSHAIRTEGRSSGPARMVGFRRHKKTPGSSLTAGE